MASNTEYFQLHQNLIMQIGHARPRKCRFCRRTFKYEFSLVQHIKQFHRKDQNQAEQQMQRSTVIQKNPNFRKNLLS